MRLSIEDAMSSSLPTRNIISKLVDNKPDRTNKGLSQMIRRCTGAKVDSRANDDFIRKRNAMYARRRTQKFKMQHIALQDEIEALEAENSRLKSDNDRLELLLARAKLEASLAQTSKIGWTANAPTHGCPQVAGSPEVVMAGASCLPIDALIVDPPLDHTVQEAVQEEGYSFVDGVGAISEMDVHSLADADWTLPSISLDIDH